MNPLEAIQLLERYACYCEYGFSCDAHETANVLRKHLIDIHIGALREAAEIADKFADGRWQRFDEGRPAQGWVGTGASVAAGKIRSRADSVEKGGQDQ
jgi:hypothetical protein